MARATRPLGALLVALALAQGLASCQLPRRPAVVIGPSTGPRATLEQVGFEQLPAVADPELLAALPALRASCQVFLRGTGPRRAPWHPLCTALAAAGEPVAAPALRKLLAAHLEAWRIGADRSGAPPAGRDGEGLVTGYFEPELEGQRERDDRFRIPLHRRPDDLLAIELDELVPELRGRRLRGRVAPAAADPARLRVVPYAARAELAAPGALDALAIAWVEDPVEAFFLQVQGSGRVRWRDGSVSRLAFSDVNGHPYRSIGRWLVERGELTLEQADAAGIAAWVRAHPQRTDELLNQNPSYVFFRELPLGDPAAGPVGAFGVPLTAGASVAVDPRYVPLGAPLVLATTDPQSGGALARWVLAQDTGGAIKGPLRFDWYWGTGRAAGERAGKQRGAVSAWLLLPRGTPPGQLLGP